VTTLAVRSAYEAESQKKIAQQQRKQAEINEIQSLNNSSKIFFASNQHADALVEALKAGEKLKRAAWKEEKSDTSMGTVATLHQAIYLKADERRENRAIEVNTLEAHNDSVISVVYSPDGKQLASASSDSTIKIWDISTGQTLNTLSGHRHIVTSVAYSPDGKNLASTSSDRTIKIWDISTGQTLKTLTGHSSEVNSVVYSPDGKQLASASWDRTIRIWDLDLDNLLISGCDLLNNYLIAHPEVLEELLSCQTSARLVPGATVLVIQGEKLARDGDIQGAVAKFRKAQQWDKSLNFDAEAKAKELAIK
jgi:WD40 repeat protein